MNQQTNKLVLVKRLKGWLALMMAVTMLFGSSMTVFAAEYTYRASNVSEITTSTEYYGGDTIRYHVSGGVKVLVYVKGVKMESQYDGSYHVVTLSGDESVVYKVSDIVIDEYSAGLYLSADIPVERDVTLDCGNNKISGISVGDTLYAGDSIKYLEDQIFSGGFGEVTLKIDGDQVVDDNWLREESDGLPYYTYTFEKDVEVTDVSFYVDDNYWAYTTITFATLSNDTPGDVGDEGEDCDHTGEDCTHKDNDADSDEEEDCDHTGEDCTHKDNDADSDEEEDCDHTGEDCTHKDNDAGSGENKEEPKAEEPKAEEPKENEEQVFTRELLESVASAKAGDNMAVDATLWHSFNANVLKELLSKEGVSYTFYYNYGGECFYITIPAGAVLEEGCEWYGPLKLNAMFGRTIIDKKDLHATINK